MHFIYPSTRVLAIATSTDTATVLVERFPLR